MISLSSHNQTMSASPIRKLVPYAEEAGKRGGKVYRPHPKAVALYSSLNERDH